MEKWAYKKALTSTFPNDMLEPFYWKLDIQNLVIEIVVFTFKNTR